MAIAAKLIRVTTDSKGRKNEHPLRTDVTDGWFVTPPVVGEVFVFGANALENKVVNNARVIRTSIVQTVDPDANGYHFTTMNSTYVLEVLDGTLPN